uniref:Integrase catalytic domain-containing protein n=1 Tax=Tanacetum cinerariifolium TaxID=118510 RepID=A0A6L2MBF6_TANCI|nr:hypothetical protein [Tanacetum cinerariifolium]
MSIKVVKDQLEKSLKEKDDLTLKLEKFETSSKNLTKMLNSQISANDKTGLGYNVHVNESEVLNNIVDSVSNSNESDEDDNQVNGRFKKSEGYHAVSPPYTGNYMPPRADLSFAGLDNFVFKSKVNETTTSMPKTKTNAYKTSMDSLEKPKTVSSINGKKYILVIVDDYSRFTWVKFLRSKDETPEFVTKFLKQIQVGLNRTVRYIRTNNGTKFVNQVMTEFYERVGIFHQKSVPRTPQQKGVVERRNHTFVKAARTMLIFSKVSMFLWAEVVATACLGKLKATTDIGIFVGYAPSRKEIPPPIVHQGVADEDDPVTHAVTNPIKKPFSQEPSYVESFAGSISSAESNQVNQPPDPLRNGQGITLLIM